jgi:hypothetical protein
MENPKEKPERPKDYYAKLLHFRNIKEIDPVRYSRALTWTENMIQDPEHIDRLRLFPDWTDDDLRSLLLDALS